MASISVLTIEGILEPESYSVGCSQESESHQQPAQMFQNTCDYPIDDCLSIKNNFKMNFDRADPMFWKQRVIFHMMASPIIVSMSFIPFSGIKCQILFLQKINLLPKIRGFVAPYLSEEDQKKLCATATVPVCHKVHDENSIDDSLVGLDLCSEELRPILRYFLKDPATAFLGITFLGYGGRLILHGWLKV